MFMSRINGKKMGERKEKKVSRESPFAEIFGACFFFQFSIFIADKELGIVMKSICNATLCLWKQVKEQG